METPIERASRVTKLIVRPQLRDDQWQRRLASKMGAEERSMFELLACEFNECANEAADPLDRYDEKHKIRTNNETERIAMQRLTHLYLNNLREKYANQQRFDDAPSADIASEF